MAMEGGQVERSSRPPATTTLDLIERLSGFEGPPEQFLVNLLAVQCQVASAVGGAMLRPGPGGRMEVMALFPSLPQGSTAPPWLAHAVELGREVMAGGAAVTRPLHDPDELYGQSPGRHLVMIPLKGQRGVRGLAAFTVEAAQESVLAASVSRLELTISLLSLYEMRLTLQRRELDIRRLQLAMEVSAAVNEHDRFMGSAMAFCNEVASRFQCDRVSLGFLKGRYVRLKAMSHTEKFSRKMKVVQDVEATMEECLDQDVEVGFPAEADASFVNRAAGELSRRHGPTSVLSLPLRMGGEVTAVVTCERPADRVMSVEQIEAMRLACDLSAPRLTNLHEHDRWIGARMASAARKIPAAVVGSKHTWVKVAVIAVFAAVAFLIFAEGDYQADGSFVLEATQRQVVPAPFDGFLESVHVEIDAKVTEGQTLLAELDDAELRLQLASAGADRLGYLKQVAAAMRDGKISDAQIAQAEADKIQAQIELLDYRIKQARIVAPMTGTVISGDWKQRIGAPVKIGDPLFEIAPLRPLRAELSVPESEIAEVKQRYEGQLRAIGKPGEPVGFVVESISPVAEVEEDRNVFKVRVRLDEIRPWMKIDMTGDAKVLIGRKKYAWLWTRKLVNWVRMKLWW